MYTPVKVSSASRRREPLCRAQLHASADWQLFLTMGARRAPLRVHCGLPVYDIVNIKTRYLFFFTIMTLHVGKLSVRA